MNQPIILLGMHRSGTSLLSNILQKLGLFIGNDIDDNYESVHFRKLNDWAMYQAGATWDNPYNMKFLDKVIIYEILEVFIKHTSNKLKRKYHKNFKSLCSGNEKWGWKDPRNTFTYPIWKEMYPDAKLIHIYRNPIDVALSLKKREEIFQQVKGSKSKTGLKKYFYEKHLIYKRIFSQSLRVNSIEEGVKLWQQYTETGLSIKKNIIHIKYEDMLEKPADILNEVCHFADIKNYESKMESLIKEIKTDRKNAFLKDDENKSKYIDIINNNTLAVKLGYNKI